MKYILVLSCFSLLWGCSPNAMYSVAGDNDYSRSDLGMPNKSGSCYAKCLIQDEYEEDIFYYFMYTGTDPSQDGIKTRVSIKEAGTKWVQKKADRGCLSADPADCLVWCSIDIPADTTITYEVLDTSIVKDFQKATRVERNLMLKGGFTEWKEIVCANDVTTELYSLIQQRLVDRGYLRDEDVDGQIAAKTKAALVKFQRDEGLPIGALDLETLDALGIRY